MSLYVPVWEEIIPNIVFVKGNWTTQDSDNANTTLAHISTSDQEYVWQKVANGIGEEMEVDNKDKPH